nr:IMP cyclohydrolase [Desulfobacterales bacterium]
MSRISRAVISVTDKTGVVDFARSLEGFGVAILSTGGTAQRLRDGGVNVQDISEYTGFPEMLDGRVKTLHPKVHGGILARRDVSEHISQLQTHKIPLIDLVVVNLYPFERTVAEPGCTFEDAIEDIDIGGPTLLRASAKNFRDVTVVVDPSDYKIVIDEMKKNNGTTTLKTRFYLARKVFQVTSKYDTVIADYLMNISLPEGEN